MYSAVQISVIGNEISPEYVVVFRARTKCVFKHQDWQKILNSLNFPYTRANFLLSCWFEFSKKKHGDIFTISMIKTGGFSPTRVRISSWKWVIFFHYTIAKFIIKAWRCIYYLHDKNEWFPNIYECEFSPIWVRSAWWKSDIFLIRVLYSSYKRVIFSL